MSLNDWMGLIVGAATLYLLWQQNQIFRQQNAIFAKQEGATMPPSDRAAKLKRYWPMLAMAVLMLSTWGAVGYDIYDRYHNPLSVSATSYFAGDLEEVKGQTIQGKTVELDGKRFEGDTFGGDEFIFHGTKHFEMIGNNFNYDTDPTGYANINVRTDSPAAYTFLHMFLRIEDEGDWNMDFKVNLLDANGNSVGMTEITPRLIHRPELLHQKQPQGVTTITQ
jgi:hypothetical protein